mgnify:CR=1 FL=1
MKTFYQSPDTLLWTLPINFRNGRVSVIMATAKNLAITIWNDLSRLYGMVVKAEPYKNPDGYLHLGQKRKRGIAKQIKKQIDKFKLTDEDLGINLNNCKTAT